MIMNTQSGPAAAPHDPFVGPALTGRVPLTEPQREIWLATQMHSEAGAAYNEGISFTFDGPLDEPALRTAIAALVARHELLRAGISPNGQWIGITDAAYELPPPQDGGIEEAEREEMSRPFDLASGPLLRFRLIRTGADQHVLLMVAHHIMVDGWSNALLQRELAELYNAALAGRAATLPPAGSFAGYVEHERAFLESAEGRQHMDYWLEQLDSPPAIADLPSDQAPPPQRSYAGSRVDLAMDPQLFGAVRALGASCGAGTVATGLAALSTLFLRTVGAADVVIGVSAAGQLFHNFEGVVGHCVNLLPLRLRLDASAAFADTLRGVSETLIDGFERRGATYGTLLSRLSYERDPQKPPLLSAVLNVTTPETLQFSGLAVRVRTLRRTSAVFDLHFEWVADPAAPRLECSYNADLFSAEMVRARLQDMLGLLAAACEQPQCATGELPLLSLPRLQQITREWNGTAAAYDLQRPLHAFIRERAAQMPDAQAVVADDAVLSYAQLEARAEALAAVLRRHGAGRDSVIGVCAQRSAALPVALLAVLKAGAAYMPLDPDYPQQRLALMIEDAQSPFILVGGGLDPELARWLARCGTPLLSIEESYPTAAAPDSAEVQPQDLAYIIFTSGSTGRPKGAMLEHRGIVNRLLWMQQAYPIGHGDRVLQKTPFSFDVSVWEFFWPLMTGATLVMAQPGGHKNPSYIVELIGQQGITVCHFVPSMLGVFLQQPDLPACASLRQVFASGEALSYELTRQFRQRLPLAQLHNLYGPTEASVDVSYWHCLPDEQRKLVPIGRPVANTQLYVLDEALRPVPPGVAGQLYLGGVQLARGYLKRPDLTAERFIEHPEFGRLYVTGDGARWLPDGVVDYLGRLDNQVKLRGLRIELGEIEARLDALPQVAESACAVRQRSAGDQRLIAWVAAAPGARLDATEIQNELRRDLPDYMIPQQLVTIPALPRLTSGKIDRKALPEPGEAQAPRAARQPPATPAEQAVAEIWKKLLGVKSVSRDDRFFDLGGHSLLAVQAVGLLRQRFDLKPSLRSVMMETLAVLAQELGGAAAPASQARPATQAAGTAQTAQTALMRQEAFYFSASGQRLFGILTRPSQALKSQALLICQSWGMEYMRSHRALQLLSARLAEMGFHVMRFDYYGTGDSAGDASQATLAMWLRNIRTAAAELRSRTGLHRLGLIGVRLGALLAAESARSGLDIANLLLWDPPASGAEWLAELRRLDQQAQISWNSQRPRGTRMPPPRAHQLFGMTMSPQWIEGVAALTPPLAAPPRIALARSRDETGAEAQPAGGLELPDASFWSHPGWLSRPWNPRASTEQVAAYLEGTLP